MLATDSSGLPGVNFDVIFHSSHTPYILVNADLPNYTVAEVNQAFLTATKRTRENLMGKPVFEIFAVNPDNSDDGVFDKIRSAFDTVIKTQQAVELPAHRYDTIDLDTGKYREIYWVSKIVPILNSDGIPTHILHSPVDVSTQYTALRKLRVANRALEEQRQQLYQVFMQAPVGIAVVLGNDYVVDLANPVICQMYGHSHKELMGKPIFSVMTESVGQGFEELLDGVMRTGVPFIGTEMAVPLKSGDTVRQAFLNFVYEPFKDSAGNIIGIVAIVIDNTGQVESKRQLAESVAQFRFMAESMPQQVWTAKADGSLDYVNQRTEEYFGRDAEDIIGAGWQEYIHAEDLPKAIETWTNSLQTGQLYQIQFRLRNSDGQYRWHLGRALPFKSKERIVQWLGTNTDIEDQKRNEQIKDEFISIASHELKTPLTSLKAYMQLLERNQALAEGPRTFVEKSVHQIKRLENLVNDLLDVSKIVGGRLNYDMQPFDLCGLIDEAVNSQQLSVSSHNIIIDCNPSVLITGDYYRLEQVIANFISNAVKYSPNGDKVIISSKVQGGQVVVSVQDFGIGIEKDQLDKLFDRFYRVDNTATKFEGLGLGLYVASEILTRHKGNFWIESEFGKGSTFFFRLPVA